MKLILILIAACFCIQCCAQKISSSASQTIQIIVPARINVNNYLQIDAGKRDKNTQTKDAGKQYFHIKSNKNYTVSVGVDGANNTLQTTMNNDTLIAIKLNDVQPEINPYSNCYSSLRPISRTQQNVSVPCLCGTDEQFSVSYNDDINNSLVYTVTEQ